VYDDNYDFYTDYWANDEYDLIDSSYFDDFNYYYGSTSNDQQPEEETGFFEEVWDSWGW